MDRKIPIDQEQEYLGNFYTHVFDKEKIFQKNKEKYFDLLAMYLLDFEPDLIVCSNYSKLLSQSFIDFVNFRNSQTQIINIHHGDLRIIDEHKNMKFKGLKGWVNEFNETNQFSTTIHHIENDQMDNGKQIEHSLPTYIEELQEIGLLKTKKELENLRVCNVVLHYHEQSKVLELLVKIIKNILV